VDGEPPDLPADGYSPLARDFVRGCLNKIPKLRPTYSMLLAHGWLASLSKPTTISEEDEELAESLGAVELASEGGMDSGAGGENTYDKEKRSGKMASATKPALHAAPLDSISPAASPAA
jgi:mitogen-activated protein kinase kinase